MEFDLGEDGKRCRTVFISWVPGGASVKVFLSLCVKWVGANKVHRTAVYDLRKHQGTIEECVGYQAFYTC